MNKILFAAIAMLLLATTSIGQQQTENNSPQSATAGDEHLIMKDGKMHHSMNGKEMMMQNQMTLHNGTIMHPDGAYQLKNGKQRRLHNGQCMDMNGKRYRSHQIFQRSMMRMHRSGMHSGGSHQHMNMSGHH